MENMNPMPLLLSAFGPKTRLLNKLNKRALRIRQLAEGLNSNDLHDQTATLRKRLGEGETLNDLCEDAFALVLAACRDAVGTTYPVLDGERTWHEIPYDEQLVGGLVLHRGGIAEMATGEGKTLASVAPVYLNALTGEGVHLVTPNDYLAARDAAAMGWMFQRLGLTVGCLQHGQTPEQVRAQYACDITYGTASAFGFDYLRDNMVLSREARVQRGHAFCLIDEIDSVLIDEGRTPLILSGALPDDDTAPFLVQAPRVEQLAHAQHRLCSQLLKEAREQTVSGDLAGAARTRLKVKWGAPRHPGFLNVMEQAEVRRAVEKLEGQLMLDHARVQRDALQEELFYCLEERSQEAAITAKGSKLLPDLPLEAESLNAAQRQSLNAVHQLIRAHALYQRDRDYIVQDDSVVIIDPTTDRPMPGRRWSDGLHQAVEAKEGVPVRRGTITKASITLPNYVLRYDKLAGMTGTAITEREEFREVYGMDVVPIPTHRLVVRDDLVDRVFQSKREKFRAVAAEVEAVADRGQPILVGTGSVEDSDLLSRMLQRRGVRHQVLNAREHARESEIISRAGQIGAVTIATNMAGRGTDIRLGEGVLELGGLYVLGTERATSRRVDRQLRGRCARQGEPGCARFFISLEDTLMRLHSGDRLGGVLGRIGLEEGEPLESRALERMLQQAQKHVEAQHTSGRRKTLRNDQAVNAHREAFYAWRNALVDAESVWTFLADDCDPERLLGLLDHLEQVVPGFEEEAMRQIALQVANQAWAGYLETVDRLRDNARWAYLKQRDPFTEFRIESAHSFDAMREGLFEEIEEAVTSQPIPPPKLSPEQDQMVEEAMEATRDDPQPKVKPSRNEPCPCGSGKKFKRCCAS